MAAGLINGIERVRVGRDGKRERAGRGRERETETETERQTGREDAHAFLPKHVVGFVFLTERTDHSY